MNTGGKSKRAEEMPTVFVVDDDPSMREALSSLIRSIDLNVKTLSSAREFLRRKTHQGPACLVLDVRMPGMSGLELQEAIPSTGRRIPIIFITAHGDIPMTVRAMKSGALEFLPKPFKEQDLLDAIHHAIERDRASLRQPTQQEVGLPEIQLDALRCEYGLTRKEKEILLLMVKGFIKKEIADHFSLSFHTINNHERRIYKKLRVHSRSAAVAKAVFEGLHLKETKP